MTSAPALSQKTTTRRQPAARFSAFKSRQRDTTSEKESNLQPPGHSSRDTRRLARAKTSASWSASSLYRPASSSLIVCESGSTTQGSQKSPTCTPCTAAAAPASKRLPARQHSITARIIAAFAVASSPLRSPLRSCVSPSIVRAGDQMPSISDATEWKRTDAIAFSAAFRPANMSSRPLLRKSRSFSSTMSSRVAPAPLGTPSLETSARYSS
mmetsp:Transcript_6433/g.26165  ORF Transcript_6433/g.26165 Transcript_6433/m.26165 type:complete len:212 (+) Transcript_6433:560-1195(+)